MQQALRKSALAALANGKRLNDEAEYLRYEEPPTTAHFLIILAQEELAKAFLLGLVCIEGNCWCQAFVLTYWHRLL
jgi:AbiV family abortive infection protein